ncbi:MAG: nucleotidyltransferase domain-containing protein [Deltaproteobacteria bacterium]|nr:nucleotidyltransferase domain-containing protein [Deltaproteobacteria bacterium]
MRTKARIELPLEQLESFSVRWRVQELSLFGSVLRDDFDSESDIDILVDFKPEAGISLFDLVTMEEELRSIFDRKVDLVTRKSIEASPNYIRRREILASVETVYVA